jgi:predicted dehydrogenase
MTSPTSSSSSSPLRLLIVGAGDRGRTYGSWILDHPAQARVVAVADPDERNRESLADQHGLSAEQRYADWRIPLADPQSYDAVILATPDHLHVEQGVAFARAGVPTLLEKPLAVNEAGCRELVEAVRESGTLFALCHVLRYTEYTRLMKRVLDEGRIGDIVSIQHLEPVGYWHQAHAFVRGNWAREADSSPMLLAKSCHDMDWLHYIVGAPCKQISSFGRLSHFRPENKPAGAAERCVDCSVADTCPYNACRIYPRLLEQGVTDWPIRVLTEQLDAEGVQKALETGRYGRCVYNGDNDVVDHQVVAMEYENGVTVNFTMTAFTGMNYGRTTRIFGTRGEILGDSRTVHVTDFLTGEQETLEPPPPDDEAGAGHGGGDGGIMVAFLQAVRGDQKGLISGIAESWNSHRSIFAAERSRKEHRVVSLDELPV